MCDGGRATQRSGNFRAMLWKGRPDATCNNGITIDHEVAVCSCLIPPAGIQRDRAAVLGASRAGGWWDAYDPVGRYGASPVISLWVLDRYKLFWAAYMF